MVKGPYLLLSSVIVAVVAGVVAGKFSSVPVELGTAFNGTLFFLQGISVNVSLNRALLKVAIVSALSSLVFTPLIALGLHNLHFLDPSTRLALAIFAVSPATVSSSTIAARNAGGDEGVAVSLAAMCNILGIATVPFVAQHLVLPYASRSDLDIKSIVTRLAIVVALPLFVGALFRTLRSVRSMVDRVSDELKLCSTMCLALTIFVQVSQAFDRLSHLSALSIIKMTIVASALHLTFCLWNVMVSWSPGLKANRASRLSLVYVCRSV